MWFALYETCISTFTANHLGMLTTDPSVILVVETYELMYILLSAIEFSKLGPDAVVRLGDVFFSWLKVNTDDSVRAIPLDVLFEVFEHMPGPATTATVSDGLTFNVEDMFEEQWVCSKSFVICDATYIVKLEK